MDAVNAIIQRARLDGTLSSLQIDEESLSQNLYSPGLPDPDLLIRTSGEMRISNFLLWEIAYAELFVTETFWPDFDRAQLLTAILDYQKRDRRFGGLSTNAAPEETKFELPDFDAEDEAASEEIAVSSQ